MQEALDDPEPPSNQLSTPMEMVSWWEKRRLLYNAIIVPFTIVIMWSLWDYVGNLLTPTHAITNAVWMILTANIFYTSAWACGILRLHYFRSYPLSTSGRWILFVLGTVFSIIVLNFNFVLLTNVLFAH